MIDNRDAQLQKLADQFSLVRKAMVTKYGGRMVHMTPVLSKVLMIVGSEKQVNIKRLAALLLVTSGAATQHVAALEEAGSVKRSMSPQDRREIIVQLTPEGHKMYQEIRKKSHLVLREVFKDLDRAELNTFIQLMGKLSSKYELDGGKNDN